MRVPTHPHGIKIVGEIAESPQRGGTLAYPGDKDHTSSSTGQESRALIGLDCGEIPTAAL